jgi:hypothetical protein
MNIEKEGIIYFLPKNKGEVNIVYYDRVNSIISNNPKNKFELEKIKKDVNFQINKKHLCCVY